LRLPRAEADRALGAVPGVARSVAVRGDAAELAAHVPARKACPRPAPEGSARNMESSGPLPPSAGETLRVAASDDGRSLLTRTLPNPLPRGGPQGRGERKERGTE